MKNKSKFHKWILIIAGSLSCGIGLIGIFVPLLPTTPFLLLAAACYFRSSKRLYNWLINHRWFGTYIKHYREHKAIPLRVKIITLTVLWGVITYSALVVLSSWFLRVLLGVIAIGVTIHILRFKTLGRELRMKSDSQSSGNE